MTALETTYSESENFNQFKDKTGLDQDDAKKYWSNFSRYEDSFLGFRITNSGNGDGYVLIGGNTWDSHLGNFGSLQDAQESALLYFMLKRPEVFHSYLHNMMMYGTGTWGSYHKLDKTLEKIDMPMPVEIGCSQDGNNGIEFNGKKLNHRALNNPHIIK